MLKPKLILSKNALNQLTELNTSMVIRICGGQKQLPLLLQQASLSTTFSMLLSNPRLWASLTTRSYKFHLLHQLELGHQKGVLFCSILNFVLVLRILARILTM
jgi:hypothetical protein